MYLRLIFICITVAIAASASPVPEFNADLGIPHHPFIAPAFIPIIPLHELAAPGQPIQLPASLETIDDEAPDFNLASAAYALRTNLALFNEVRHVRISYETMRSLFMFADEYGTQYFNSPPCEEFIVYDYPLQLGADNIHPFSVRLAQALPTAHTVIALDEQGMTALRYIVRDAIEAHVDTSTFLTKFISLSEEMMGKMDVNVPVTIEGDTMLHDVAKAGRTDLANALLGIGALVDGLEPSAHHTCFTPLAVALLSGHLETAWYLLQRGANPNVQCQDFSYPLLGMLVTNLGPALESDTDESVDSGDESDSVHDNDMRLVPGEPNETNMLSSFSRSTSTRWLTAPQMQRIYDIVEFMVRQRNVDINAQVNEYTAIECAVDRDNAFAATVFVEHGADPRTVGVTGENLLHMAARLGDEPLARAVLERVGDDEKVVNAVHEGSSPLMMAVAGLRVGVVKLLLDTGNADVNQAKDSSGDTPLIILARTHVRGSTSKEAVFIAKMLLEKGARVDQKNAAQETPLAIALKLERHELATVFFQ